MQRVLEKKPREEKPAKPTPPPLKGAGISAPKMMLMRLPVRNMAGSPLVLHAFSAKARQTMRATQEAGSVAKKNRKRDPKDFDALFHNARHISTDGWDGVSAAAFRNAAIDACRLCGFAMTMGRMTLFIEADGVDSADGTPLVQVHGTPVPFESMVRNQTGVADIRVRPRWDSWMATVSVRFDAEVFTAEDIVALFERAGSQCGVGEGRPNSKKSFGQGWGLFEIDAGGDRQIRLEELPRKSYQFIIDKVD